MPPFPLCAIVLGEGEATMPFKTGERARVLHFGNLIEGTIIDTAKDDAGNLVYQVEAPNSAFGEPSKWVKASEVFAVKLSPEEKRLKELKEIDQRRKVAEVLAGSPSPFERPRF